MAELDKRFATARAVLALKGYTLNAVDAHGHAEYVVGRWSWARPLPTLESVEHFAALVGGKL